MCGVSACENIQKHVSHGETVGDGSSVYNVVLYPLKGEENNLTRKGGQSEPTFFIFIYFYVLIF